jgi:hypothetical protein
MCYYPVLIGYSHVYTRVRYTSSLYLNFRNYFRYARTEGACGKVVLAYLIRFLVVELTYSASNPKFDMVLYLRLIILSVGGDVHVDNKTLLVTDFVNLKIKLTQSFRGAHRDNIYVRVFIKVSPRTCINILCFSKKEVHATCQNF